ncbi:DNA polymerase III subunit delta [Candidatus Anaplasma sp. TIGMIC]|uniref:DNA polymerase III subunit delta n=1 Tax=Candidatus Anaplasma sp. TIGMIC TaxID=3020713 RepID=UPI002330DED1|nr:DNA polymerase III subunit delta [Candidatus Anaplasma sp. TIGMIC]MDB1135625.1 DNA polymerase III subunit delta [Candidatus Anaplasma sp. TIGMIC]
MRFTASKIKDFFSNPGAYGSVLLYGNDHSRISFYEDKIAQLVTKDQECSILRMEFTHACKEPEQLLVDLTTIPMFHKKSLVIITDAKDTLGSELKSALDKIDRQHCYVIMQARELVSTSSLRAYYNNHPTFAAIALYKEDSVDSIVSEFLSDNNISYDRQTFRLLCDLMQESNACIKPELQKLLLFLGSRKTLTSADLEKSFAADLDPALDDICAAIAGGDVAAFSKISDALLQNKVAAVLIIRSSIKYFLTLEYLARRVKFGDDINAAIKSHPTPVFFRLIPQLKKHVSSMPYKLLQLVIHRLHDAEAQCKLAESSSESTFKFLMYSLVLSVRQASQGT